MKWLLLCALLLGCDPQPGDSWQIGQTWCQVLLDHTIYCEDLEGEKEVR